MTREKDILYAKLKLLDALGDLVDHLGLDRLAAGRHELHIDLWQAAIGLI